MILGQDATIHKMVDNSGPHMDPWGMVFGTRGKEKQAFRPGLTVSTLLLDKSVQKVYMIMYSYFGHSRISLMSFTTLTAKAIVLCY